MLAKKEIEKKAKQDSKKLAETSIHLPDTLAHQDLFVISLRGDLKVLLANGQNFPHGKP